MKPNFSMIHKPHTFVHGQIHFLFCSRLQYWITCALMKTVEAGCGDTFTCMYIYTFCMSFNSCI